MRLILAVSPSAAVLYDWVVTLPREAQLFWAGKARPLPAMLYFANRYLNMLPLTAVLFSIALVSDKVSSLFMTLPWNLKTRTERLPAEGVR